MHLFVSCSNAVKFTHEGKVLVIVRVVRPPSIIISEDMKSKEHECNEAPQQSIRHSTYPISTIASSSPEAYLLDHTSGMSDPPCSPLNIAGHSFPESSTPTEALAGISGILSSGSRMCFSSDCQDSYTAKTAEFYQIGEMVGEVNSSEMQTGEHIAASSLSLQIAGDSASSANKDKVVEDIVWLEFHIVDTGIGISGISTRPLFDTASHTVFCVWLAPQICLPEIGPRTSGLCRLNGRVIISLCIEAYRVAQIYKFEVDDCQWPYQYTDLLQNRQYQLYSIDLPKPATHMPGFMVALVLDCISASSWYVVYCLVMSFIKLCEHIE